MCTKLYRCYVIPTITAVLLLHKFNSWMNTTETMSLCYIMKQALQWIVVAIIIAKKLEMLDGAFQMTCNKDYASVFVQLVDPWPFKVIWELPWFFCLWRRIMLWVHNGGMPAWAITAVYRLSWMRSMQKHVQKLYIFPLQWPWLFKAPGSWAGRELDW